MRRPIVLALPLLLGLAACSGGEDTTGNAPGGGDAPAGGESGTVALETMPEAFRGRWDFALEDCDLPASEMRLMVEPDRIDFYESTAEPVSITQTGPRALTVEHAFSGEGEQSTETLAYELNEAGDRLTVTSPDGSMSTRMRCP